MNNTIIAPFWTETEDGELLYSHLPLISICNGFLCGLSVLVSFPTYSDDTREPITECYWVDVTELNLSGPPLQLGWWDDSTILMDVVRELWDNWSTTGCIEGIAEDYEPDFTVTGHGVITEQMYRYVCSLKSEVTN